MSIATLVGNKNVLDRVNSFVHWKRIVGENHKKVEFVIKGTGCTAKVGLNHQVGLWDGIKKDGTILHTPERFR